jgi:5'-nucleotidase
VRKLGPKRFAVDGTPTDSVMLALQEIMRAAPPTLCLSGINRGANLADDVTYSGTVAAAMEATILGVPAIALSQVASGAHPIKWKTAEHFAGGIVRKLAALGWPQNVLMNVNFPDVPHAKVRGTVRAVQGRYKTSDDIVRNLDPRGQAYYWIGAAVRGHDERKGTDIWATDRGYNTVTALHLDLTHRATHKKLGRQFGDAP